MEFKEKEYFKNWWKEENFWLDYGPLMFNAKKWDDAYDEVRQIQKLVHLPEGAEIFDSCCGVGRHCLEFAQMGMKMTGLDWTLPYIEAAKETAESMNLDIRFIHGDMRNFCEPNRFDLAMNMYTSFGYFETDEEETNYLLNIYKSLKPGGKFLIDHISKEALARDFVEDEWFEEEGNIICLSYEIIEDFERLVNRWMIIDKNGKRKDFKFSHKIYSGREMKDLLSKAGFVNVKVYGNLNGSEYNQKVERMIAVAEKPIL